MSEHLELEAVVETDSSGVGAVTVKAPGVGIYSRAPRRGEILVGGSSVGRLSTLGVSREVFLPVGITGRVAERFVPNLRDAVSYGQAVLQLVPVQESEVGVGVEGPAIGETAGLPEGCFAVTAPTHGMFYRRSTPDAPPYVEAGDTVEDGATLALVEVMKCFSAITYGGRGLPSRAEVVEVRAEDGSEVEAEGVLFVMRPA